MPRVSTDKTEAAYAGFLRLADGDSRRVLRAMAPHTNGSLVSFAEVVERLVAWRIHAQNPKVAIGVHPRQVRPKRRWFRW